MVRISRLAGAVGAFLLVMGRSTDSDEQPSGSGETPTAAVARAATDGLPGEQMIDASQAQRLTEAEYELVRRVPDSDGKRDSYFAAIGDDGAIVVTRWPSTSDLSSQMADSTIHLVTPDGRDTLIERMPHLGPVQGVGNVAINQGYVVWTEAPGTDLYLDSWTLYAYDRDTGKVRKLAKAPKIDGHAPPFAPGWTGPRLAGERVAWAEVHGKDLHERVDIMACEITDCDPKIMIRGAAYPATDGANAYGVRWSKFADRTGQVDRTAQIVRAELETGQLTVVRDLDLPKRAAVNGLAASPTGLVWTTSPGKPRKEQLASATVLRFDTGEEQVVPAAPGGTFVYPEMSERVAMWAGSKQKGTAGYIYDLERNKVWGYGTTHGLYQHHVAGDLVRWQEKTRGRDGKEKFAAVVARLK